MMGAHDPVELPPAHHQPLTHSRNEDFPASSSLGSYGSSSSPSHLARYQSATFSSAAQDRRFSNGMSPSHSASLGDASRRSSSKHKWAGMSPEHLLSSTRCKCGSALDLSCGAMRHNCNDPQASPNHSNVYVGVSNQHMWDTDRMARLATMNPQNPIDPPDFSPNRGENGSSRVTPGPIVKHNHAAQHKPTVAEALCFKEATIVASSDRPHAPASESKGILPASGDSDVVASPRRATRDRRQLPGHRASLDGGIWPASYIKLSALTRFHHSSHGDKLITQKEESRSASQPSDGVLEKAAASVNGKPLTVLLSDKHAADPPSKIEKTDTAKVRSKDSLEREKVKSAISLGKQLGEHFQNFDTSHVRQQLVKADKSGAKNDREIRNAGPDKVEQGENVKPMDNLNNKLQHRLESILEIPPPKTTAKTSSSTSLRQAVVSLLAPNRTKNLNPGTKKEEKSRGPLMRLSRSSSHSSGSSLSSSTSTGLSAKVIRSFSLDHGREAGVMSKGLKRGSKNGLLASHSAERSCKSYDGIDSADSCGCIMSDTESSSSGGSMTKPRELSSCQSGIGDGESASPASFSRRFNARHSAVGNGDVKPSSASHRRSSTTLPAFGRDASFTSSRRFNELSTSSAGAAMDVALLHNRYLQWRYLNASMKVATGSQDSMAESLLFNACMRLFELRKSVATKQMALNKANLDLKLSNIIHKLSGTLEEWDTVKEAYLSSIGTLIKALEIAVINVPLHGVHVRTRFVKDALMFGEFVMEEMSHSINRLLPQAEIVDPLLYELAGIVVLEQRCLEELSEIKDAISNMEVEERCLQISLVQMETQKPILSIH